MSTLSRVDDVGINDGGSLLRRVADQYGDREAYVDGDTRLSFGRWDEAADAVACHLRDLGVTKGDVVLVAMGSCVDYPIVYLAAMRLGAITSGVNPRLGPSEISSIVERARPRVMVVDPIVASIPEGLPTGALLLRSEVDEAVRVGGRPARFPKISEEDPVAIVWTSGTTGQPKGAVFDHACLRAMERGSGVLSAPGDRRLSPNPFAHVGFFTRVWDELVHFITTVIIPTPWRATDHLRLIADESITVGQGVPTQWRLVLDHPDLARTDTSSLRITSTGATRVPPELVRAMRDAFGVPVVVRYTSTEASVSTGTSVDDDDEVIANTVGRAAPNVELRLAGDDGGPVSRGHVGEVLIRSRATMRYYWQDPVRTAEVRDDDGWIHTGDMGRFDEQDNLAIVGRRAEMYIRGGYNIYPAEVERALGEHPGVSAVAVVGVPDPVLGQIGAAAVIPVDASSPPSLEELRSWCRERLADYKAPDRLVIADQFPLTAMAKVDKRALVDLMTDPSGVSTAHRAS
jgi:acyl-CoA synthetase (AMP-forming)/AMP-acid ligase II